MDSLTILHTMCHEILSDSDIKTIAKSRCFPAKATSSRTTFYQYYLSEIGVKKAIESLSHAELIGLHLLHYQNKYAKVDFFTRIYGAQDDQYFTYTQRYAATFKEVQRSLVRKGILMIHLTSSYSGETKMERWRFLFPSEFAKFLPPPAKEIIQSDVAGTINQEALRQTLLNAINQSHVNPEDTNNKNPITLIDGELQIKNQIFTANKLYRWQLDNWKKRGTPKKSPAQYSYEYTEKEDTSFLPILNYAFDLLEPNQWIPSDGFATLLQLHANNKSEPNCKKVFTIGWELGCLVKHHHAGKDYYKRTDGLADLNNKPEDYLQLNKDGSFLVDIHTIPYRDLEVLAKIADFNISKKQVIMSSNLIKLGRQYNFILPQPLFLWLKDKSATFCEHAETVAKCWGKLILHDNLLIAKIQNISLKVQLEKAFSKSQQITLAPDYIAFPTDLLHDVEKVVVKSGYAIKRQKVS